MLRTALHRIIATLALLVPLLLGACSQDNTLQRIQSRGELIVVTRNSPTTFYLDKSGATGFEHALAKRLADELGVNLKMAPAHRIDDIFHQLDRRDADIAAAGLTLTGPRQAIYPHSMPYFQQRPQVVYIAGTFRPRSVDDLPGMSMLVLQDSSHAQSLELLRSGGLEGLNWEEIPGAETMELLERVNGGEAQLAIIDSHEFEVQQSLYPRLKVAFDLGSEQAMVWFLPPDGENNSLLELVDNLLLSMIEDGSMTALQEEFFGHSSTVSRIGSHTFNRNMDKRLPQYQSLIEQVAQEYQMDWPLLAAIAYQESHWDPTATSPTGVRGMMMLTLPTAREMNVDNRLDPTQSLRGGARYLKNIKRRLPDDIAEPDRTWLALAAYNIGMGHLEDARVLTQRAGGDPDLWTDVMERLPLLQKSKHYQNTRYGYARGQEAVTYVQNIRHYYNILQWQDIADSQRLPPVLTEDFVPAVVSNTALFAL